MISLSHIVGNTDDFELALTEDVSKFYADPLGWVLWAFDWDEGELKGFTGPDDWQVDILNAIGDSVKNKGFDGVIPVDPTRVAVASGHGIGKGHPLCHDAKKVIINPHTKRAVTMQNVKWGDLKKGDYVFGKDGKPTKITGTNHYKREHYKVTFDDGSSLIVSGEHEWNVRGRQERRTKSDTWRTMTTEDILNAGVKRPNGKAFARQWEIPTCDPVQFEYDGNHYDPYRVGMWLGDGSSAAGVVSSTRMELWERMGVYPDTSSKAYIKQGLIQQTIPGLKAALTACGMMPVTCDTKFIADVYKYNSEAVRRELVAGMLDSDGEVYASGSIGYSSTSKRLVEDLMWMVRSLGGKAMMHPTPKTTFYTKDGVRSAECKPCYRCTINFGGKWNPFTHIHKRAMLSDKVEDRYTKRWIDSIEPVGMREGMCIEVEAEDHLYLANDFIVTHNSALTAWVILWIMSTRPYAKGVVTANTSDQLRTKTWGELGKWRIRCQVGHWFEYNNGRGSMSLYHADYPESWRVDAQTCREENSESFAGLHAANSTPFYLFDEACHDDQTEVMTSTGWKYFKDITADDELLTMNTDTRVAYYDKPTHLHVTDYSGDLLVSDVRGCNFAVTPNHRMLFQSRKRPELQFQEAGVMKWNNKKFMRHIKWEGLSVDNHVIPAYDSRRVSHADHTVDMNDWLEFLGWFITEGHVASQSWVNKDGTVNSEYNGVVVTQKQEHYTDEIEACVKRMGLPYTRRSTGIWVNSVALAAHLDSDVGKGFAGKRVPDYLFSLPPVQINKFLDAAVKGDGYRKGTGRIIYTSSPELAEDYNRLALLSGVNSTITKRQLEGMSTWVVDHFAVSSCDGYVVSVTDKPTYIDCNRAEPKSVHYEGKVYCATISGGVLYTRRNGYTLWSGNSAVPDKIWEVAEGGLTDGEPMFLCFGNPTRNSGRFRECFGRSAHRWITRQIDSRTAKMTNKKLIKQWADDWGEDSDFFRVRVLGRFPRGGDMQFIPTDDVSASMKRGSGMYLGDDPLICGVDLARGGEDNCFIQFRRGSDAVSEKVYRIPGEKSRDSMRVVSMLTTLFERHQPDVIFVDETGLGGPIADRLNQLGYHVIGVNFGAEADDKRYYRNKSAEMWSRMRDWIMKGGSVPDDPELEQQLCGREYSHNDKQQLVLESKDDMKKRGLSSPDWADALALTFAFNVPPREKTRGHLDRLAMLQDEMKGGDYDPLDNV